MAGSDSSIYNMIRPQAMVKLEDPDEIQAKRLTLQNLMQQGEVGKLGLEEARSGSERARRLQDFFATNPNAKPDQIAPIDYKAAAALRKELLEGDVKLAGIGKDKAAAGKSKFDIQLKQLEHGAAMMNLAKDQASYDMVLEIGRSAGIFAPDVKFPPKYSPLAVKALQEVGLTRAQQLSDDRAREGQGITMRGQDMTAATAQAGHGVTMRGQNMTDARARETATQGGRTYDSDRGLVVDTRAGTAAPVIVGGAPVAAKDKPLTEFQSKGQLFGTRAAEADKIISDISANGDNFPGSIKATAGEVPLIGGALEMAINPLPGFMGGPSASQQKVEQAQRNFINAVLRVESGAVISESEFVNAQKQYFPKRGDTKSVIEQKTANRRSTIEGLRVASGPAGPRVAAAAAQAAPTSAEIDAELRRRKVIQ